MTNDLDISENPTLNEVQAHFTRTCVHHKWDGISNENVFLLFIEEVGELAKAIRKTSKLMGESAKGNSSEAEIRSNLEEEFADCFSYLIDLANRYDVKLGSAYQEKTRVNLKRTWE